MGFFSAVKNLFRRKPKGEAWVLCPHCQKPMDDEHTCEGESEEERRSTGLTRRFFFGVLAAPVIAPAIGRIYREAVSKLHIGDIVVAKFTPDHQLHFNPRVHPEFQAILGAPILTIDAIANGKTDRLINFDTLSGVPFYIAPTAMQITAAALHYPYSRRADPRVSIDVQHIYRERKVYS